MDEHVHLHPPHAFFVHPEPDPKRMPEGNGGKSGEEIGVFRLVPVRGELVGGTDKEGITLNGQGLGGLEPGAIRLLRKHLPGSLAEAIPKFGWRKRHQRGREARERRGAKLSLRMWTSQLRDTPFGFVSANKSLAMPKSAGSHLDRKPSDGVCYEASPRRHFTTHSSRAPFARVRRTASFSESHHGQAHISSS